MRNLHFNTYSTSLDEVQCMNSTNYEANWNCLLTSLLSTYQMLYVDVCKQMSNHRHRLSTSL